MSAAFSAAASVDSAAEFFPLGLNALFCRDRVQQHAARRTYDHLEIPCKTN